MNKKIGIIGAGGKMGNMFANYFIKMGFEVVGYDESNEIKCKKRIERSKNTLSKI